MKCRLNPNFVSNLKSLGKFLLAILLIGIGTQIVSFTLGYLLYSLDCHQIMINMITANNKNIEYIPDVASYILKAGRGFALFSLFTLIVIAIISLILYVVITETIESYRIKSKDLKYKFDGIKQPWYRVLLSYIIVCDKTA